MARPHFTGGCALRAAVLVAAVVLGLAAGGAAQLCNNTCPAANQFRRQDCSDAAPPFLLDAHDLNGATTLPSVTLFGAWINTAFGVGNLGNFFHDGNQQTPHTAVFNFSESAAIPIRAVYTVDSFIPSGFSVADGIRYIVQHDGGTTVVLINQTDSVAGSEFVFVGNFTFDTIGTVSIVNSNAQGVIQAGFTIADALRVRPVEANVALGLPVICEACTVCSAVQFEVAACQASANTQCQACATACPGADQFVTANCSATADLACANCTVCAQDQFETAACRLFGDRACQACTQGACPPDFFESAACGGTSDRVCSPCSACVGNTFAVAGSCTGSSDTTCAPCSACGMGQFEAAACSATSDTGCANITVCGAGQTEQQAPTPTSDRLCACAAGFFTNGSSCSPVSTCGPGELVGAQPTLTSDRLCAACPPPQFQDEVGHARQTCKFPSICSPGDEVSSPPTPTSNTVCSACPIGTEQPSFGGTVCTACSVGTFQDEEGEANCKPVTPCAAGEGQAVPGNTTTDQACAPCGPGTFQDEVGLQACKPCVGSFTAASGQMSCTAFRVCGPGETVGTPGSAVADVVCADCAPGTFQPGQGSLAAAVPCQPCPPGNASQAPRAAACPACVLGATFQDEAGQQACDPVSLCAATTEFASAPPTRSSDVGCSNVTSCAMGQFQDQAPTPTSDRGCATCAVCNSPAQFEAAPCSAAADTQCLVCSACPTGQRVQALCQGSTDTQCVLACDEDEFFSPREIVLDQTLDSESAPGTVVSGADWMPVNFLPGFLGASYFSYNGLARGPEINVSIPFRVARSGMYEVFLTNAPATNRDTIPIVLDTAQGVQTAQFRAFVASTINPTSIGTFAFDNTSDHSITWSTDGTTIVVVADAAILSIREPGVATNALEAAQCTNCTVCDPGFFDLVKCNLTNDAECAACDTCRAGEFESTACAPSQNRACSACTAACPPETFFVEACNATADLRCDACTPQCDPQVEFEMVPCTNSSNRNCANLTQCVVGTTFELAAATPTSDRSCQPCAACGALQFTAQPCSGTQDSVCGNCTLGCPADQFQSAACSAAADTVCTNCTVCAAGEFVRAACNATADTVCAPIVSNFTYGPFTEFSPSCAVQTRTRVESCADPACLASSRLATIETRDTNGGCDQFCQLNKDQTGAAAVECFCTLGFSISTIDNVTCVPDSCGVAPALPNADRLTPTEVLTGGRARFRCRPGFSKDGTMEETMRNITLRCDVGGAFVRDPPDPRDCVDIDECVLAQDNCTAAAPCSNLPGSFCCQDVGVNFTYGPFTPFSTSCGPGVRTRTESCITQCPGSMCVNPQATLEMRDIPCPIDAPFVYGPFPPFVQTCANQTRTRTETCNAQFGGVCFNRQATEEVLLNGGCDQVCDEVSDGIFIDVVCSCDPRFNLEADGRTCTPIPTTTPTSTPTTSPATTPTTSGTSTPATTATTSATTTVIPVIANGTCSGVGGGQVQCVCDAGFELDGPEACRDTDECATGNGGCSDTCTNAVGSFACSCPATAALRNGTTCVDIDECLGMPGCAELCVNEDPGFRCECGAGRQLAADGTSCEAVDCGVPPLVLVNSTGFLVQVDSGLGNPLQFGQRVSYRCTTGFATPEDMTLFTVTCGATGALNLEECIDIDECALGSASCAGGQACVNTPGSFRCDCAAGFVAAGSACVDEDECVAGTDNCDANALCTNNVGGFSCACNAGFAGDGVSCADVDECTAGTDNCDGDATCTNNAGGFSCACNAGFAGDGTACADVDECTAGTDDCGANAVCTNNVGGFSCACPAGFEPDPADARACVALLQQVDLLAVGATMGNAALIEGDLHTDGGSFLSTQTFAVGSPSSVVTEFRQMVGTGGYIYSKATADGSVVDHALFSSAMANRITFFYRAAESPSTMRSVVFNFAAPALQDQELHRVMLVISGTTATLFVDSAPVAVQTLVSANLVDCGAPSLSCVTLVGSLGDGSAASPFTGVIRTVVVHVGVALAAQPAAAAQRVGVGAATFDVLDAATGATFGGIVARGDGRGFDFDGTGAIVSNAHGTAPDPTTGDFSIAVTAQRTPGSAGGYLVAKTESDDSLRYYSLYHSNSETLLFFYKARGNNGKLRVSFGRVTLTDGSFHRVFVSVRGTTAELFVDGVSVSVQTLVGLVDDCGMASRTCVLQAGRRSGGANGVLFFTGAIAEVTIYTQTGLTFDPSRLPPV